jgi:hypothetical protein
MAAYLKSPPPPGAASSCPVVPMTISTSVDFKNMEGIGTKGGASGSQMSYPGDPTGINAANILGPPAISTRLHSYCSLHSDPGSLSVSCPPPSSAFVRSGNPPSLAAFSGFVGACLPESPPLPSVRRPDPEEEVLISPCFHCGSMLPSLVSFAGRAKLHSGGHLTGHHSVARHMGGVLCHPPLEDMGVLPPPLLWLSVMGSLLPWLAMTRSGLPPPWKTCPA